LKIEESLINYYAKHLDIN